MTFEFHPKGWSIIGGIYPTSWSFGIYFEIARSEQEFRLGLGPFDLYVWRAS